MYLPADLKLLGSVNPSLKQGDSRSLCSLTLSRTVEPTQSSQVYITVSQVYAGVESIEFQMGFHPNTVGE